MLINEQEWQDAQSYIEFISKKEKESKSKIEVMKGELEYLKEMIDAKKEYIETPLRASENILILPGGRKIIPVDIHPDWLRDYNCTVEGLFLLNYNSWLEVYPFLQPIYNQMCEIMVNRAQIGLAKKVPYSYSKNLKTECTGIYIQDIDRLIDITLSEGLLHTAYNISRGDEIATLKLKTR